MDQDRGAIKEKRAAVKQSRLTYLRNHPELTHLLETFTRAAVLRRPYNLNAFAKEFFTQPSLKSVLAQARDAEASRSEIKLDESAQRLFDLTLSLPITPSPPVSHRPESIALYLSEDSNTLDHEKQAIQELFSEMTPSNALPSDPASSMSVQDLTDSLAERSKAGLPFARLIMCNDAPDFAGDDYKGGNIPAVAQWVNNVRSGCHSFHASHEATKLPTLWLHAGNMFGPDLYKPLPIRLLDGYEMEGVGVTARIPEELRGFGRLAVRPELSGGVYPAIRVLQECSIDILLPGDKDLNVSQVQLGDLMQRHRDTAWVMSNLKFDQPKFFDSNIGIAWRSGSLLYAHDLNSRGDNIDYFTGANMWADRGFLYLPLLIGNHLVFVLNLISPEFVSTYQMVNLGANDIEEDFVHCIESHVLHFEKCLEGVSITNLFTSATLHVTVHGSLELAMSLWQGIKKNETVFGTFQTNIIVSVVDDAGECYRLAASPVMSAGSRWNNACVVHLFNDEDTAARKANGTIDSVFPRGNSTTLLVPFTRSLKSSGLRLSGMSDLGDAYIKSWDSLLQLFQSVDSGNSGVLSMVEFIALASRLSETQSEDQYELLRGPQQADWRKWACDVFRTLDADGDAVTDFESVFLLLHNRRAVREYSQFARDRHSDLGFGENMTRQEFKSFVEALTSDELTRRLVADLFTFLSHDQPNGMVSLRNFFRSHSILSMVTDKLQTHNSVYCAVRKQIRRNERLARDYFKFDVAWRKPLVCLTSALDALTHSGSRIAQFNTARKFITSRSTPFTTMMALAQVNLGFLEEICAPGNEYNVSMTDTVVPLLMAGSYGNSDVLESPVSVRDICSIDPHPNNLFICRVTYAELRSFLIAGLASVFSRDMLTPYTTPVFEGFPALANVGIIFNIDEPEKSILFDTNANHSNTLEGAKLVPLSEELDLVLLTDEFCKSGGNQYTFVIPNERWQMLTREGFAVKDKPKPIKKKRARASTTLAKAPSPSLNDTAYIDALTNTYGDVNLGDSLRSLKKGDTPDSPTSSKGRRARSASIAVPGANKKGSSVFDLEEVTTAPATRLLTEEQQEFARWRAHEPLKLDDVTTSALRRSNVLRFLYRFGTATELVVEDFNQVSVWFVDNDGKVPTDTPLADLYDSELYSYHRSIQGYEYQIRKQVRRFREDYTGLVSLPAGKLPLRDLRRLQSEVSRFYPAVLSSMGSDTPENRTEPWDRLTKDAAELVEVNQFLELEVARRHALLYGQMSPT